MKRRAFPGPGSNLSKKPTTSAAISAEEERDLVLRAKAGDKFAANKLVAAHTPYMHAMAYAFARSRAWANVDDLVSACMMGFSIALARFEVERGLRLLTYASYWMLNAMQEEQDLSSMFGKVPSSAADRVLRVAREHGFRSVEETMAASGAKRSTVEGALAMSRARHTTSIDAHHDSLNGETGGYTLGDFLRDGSPDPEQQFAAAQEERLVREAVARALRQLDPRTRSVIVDSTMAEERVSLASLGRQLGLSRERARQIEARGLVKLRECIEDELDHDEDGVPASQTRVAVGRRAA